MANWNFMSEKQTKTILKNKPSALEKIDEIAANTNDLNGNGNQALVKTKDLPVAAMVSNEQLIAEERDLVKSEDGIQKKLRGLARLVTLRKSFACDRLALALFVP